jgi:signal transduction histidine kinase
MAATMLGFGGSELYSQRVASRLDQEALSIATDASPAIEHLSVARGEFLRIQLTAVFAVQGLREGFAPDRAPFDESLARIRHELSIYAQLPFYPYERDQYEQADDAIRALEAEVSGLWTHLRAGDLKGTILARARVATAAARADAAIGGLVIYNARQQHRLGMTIPKLRVHAARVGYGLDALTAALGLIAMGLVWRAIRGHTRVLAQQKRVTQEYAESVAAFGSRLQLLAGSSVKIAEAITTARGLREVMQIIVEQALVVSKASYCALGCGVDPERPFDPWIFAGMPATIAQALGTTPRPVGLLGLVVTEARVVRVGDVRSHAAYRGLPAHHPAIGPFLGIPILRGRRNLANLYLAREVGQPEFSGDDERAATLLAADVAVAIDNARLYNEALAATRAREDLLATVSHDLKNPLSAIRLSTAMWRKTVPDGKSGELAARIDRAAERMMGLISDLLDASKIEAGALRTVRIPEDVASLVRAAVDLFALAANEESIHLRATAPSRPLTVSCERGLILRVLSNLIGNALKFSPGGSSVSVAAEELQGQIQFSVIDAGPGIPAEHLPHVFDRYWQQQGGDRRGSGLGLYIAKGIVEAHEGKIWITSAPGQGTTVRFTLPLVPDGA